MEHFEIPATDFSRAVSFYKAILGLDIKASEMFDTKMGFLPTDGKNVSGAIVQGKDYKPSSNDSPEMGYFGMFIDTEGNKMAVHSIN